jgi:hypothetical protein
MKQFFLYIFFLCCIILGFSYYNTYISKKEHFDINNETFILLGDSIIKNNSYISNGKPIEEIILERTNGKSHCYAKDHSKIVDVYNQVSLIPLEYNNSNTLIFLSVGGNDILSHYVDQEGDSTDSSILKPMFSSYKKLIESIKIRLPLAKLYLLDIYYPNNIKYKPFHTILSEWNSMIYNYAENPKNNISGVIKISNIITQEDDFTFGIEPSSKGGTKIADYILSV